jgi:hypothetical protein
MANMSFNEAAATVAKPIEVEVQQVKKEDLVPETSTNTELSVHVEADKRGFAGEISRSDIQLPYLSIVQKTSDLADNFKSGSVVFAKEVQLAPPGQPCEVIILKLAKLYEEEIPYGTEDARPQIFASIKDARAAGFDETYGAEKRVVTRGDMDVLVKAPATFANPVHETMFSFEAGGAKYALARWTVRKGAYKTTAGAIITALQLGSALKEGIWAATWNLTVNTESNAKNTWYQPYLKISGKTSPEVLDLIRDLKGE